MAPVPPSPWLYVPGLWDVGWGGDSDPGINERHPGEPTPTGLTRVEPPLVNFGRVGCYLTSRKVSQKPTQPKFTTETMLCMASQRTLIEKVCQGTGGSSTGNPKKSFKDTSKVKNDCCKFRLCWLLDNFTRN